jgi:hypothetical protein
MTATLLSALAGVALAPAKPSNAMLTFITKVINYWTPLLLMAAVGVFFIGIGMLIVGHRGAMTKIAHAALGLFLLAFAMPIVRAIWEATGKAWPIK